MLSLTNLNASSRNISNIVGLEAARNLVSLDLQINRLTNFSLPNTLTNLTVLDLSFNSLTTCSFPGGPDQVKQPLTCPTTCSANVSACLRT